MFDGPAAAGPYSHLNQMQTDRQYATHQSFTVTAHQEAARTGRMGDRRESGTRSLG